MAQDAELDIIGTFILFNFLFSKMVATSEAKAMSDSMKLLANRFDLTSLL